MTFFKPQTVWQTFLLDEKSYATTTLVDPSLQDGSALIAMNDE